MTRLGMLLSGRGSNFLAIAEAIRRSEILGVEIAVVVSNKEDAPGLVSARALGIPALALTAKGRTRNEYDSSLVAALREHAVDLVCLAGYMRIISSSFIAAFPKGILNVHPSLLPAFPGLHAQHQALEYGAKIAGCTIHFVDEQVDHGLIILQRTVVVEDDDTAETLAARILIEEHLAYPDAIRRVLSGKYVAEGRRYILRVT